MAALDRKNLVKDGKFNRTEIMKRAWAYVKNVAYYRNDFKGALKAAWVDAKLVMDDYLLDKKLEGKPLFPNKGLSVADLRPSGRANNFMYGF